MWVSRRIIHALAVPWKLSVPIVTLSVPIVALSISIVALSIAVVALSKAVTVPTDMMTLTCAITISATMETHMTLYTATGMSVAVVVTLVEITLGLIETTFAVGLTMMARMTIA